MTSAVSQVLAYARDWALGMLSFGAVAITACLGGYLLFRLVSAFLTAPPVDDGDDL